MGNGRKGEERSLPVSRLHRTFLSLSPHFSPAPGISASSHSQHKLCNNDCDLREAHTRPLSLGSSPFPLAQELPREFETPTSFQLDLKGSHPHGSFNRGGHPESAAEAGLDPGLALLSTAVGCRGWRAAMTSGLSVRGRPMFSQRSRGVFILRLFWTSGLRPGHFLRKQGFWKSAVHQLLLNHPVRAGAGAAGPEVYTVRRPVPSLGLARPGGGCDREQRAWG